MMTYGAFPLANFSWWPKLVAPLADHLWQSTLFALLIATVARMLRKNRPQMRHSLWLCASAKFLIPFSLLAALGAALAPAMRQVLAGPAVLWDETLHSPLLQELTRHFLATLFRLQPRTL